MITRREFGQLALASLALPRFASAQVVGGVHLGVQTYSYRDLPRPAGGDAVDVIIASMKSNGLTECELWAPQVEPQFPTGARGGRGERGAPPSPEAIKAREDTRKWRLETPLSHFTDVAKKFK